MDVSSDNIVPAKRGNKWKRLGIALGAVLAVVLLAAGFVVWRMSYVPSDLNLASTRVSEHAIFRATIKPAIDPIPVNQMHTWTLYVESPEGQPIADATITVNGDMPQHGHGLPTKPAVSGYLGNGDYQVDGLKFQMTGWWVVDFDIAVAGKTDRVSFNLLLK